MSRPKTISILGVPFRVLEVKAVDKEGSYGECDGLARTIKIKAGLSEDLYEYTLLHEIIHSVLYMSGQTEYLKIETEEAIVVALETGLGQIYGRLE